MTSEYDAIKVAQQAIKLSALSDWAAVEQAIVLIIAEKLWEGRSDSFGEFCLKAAPMGLGVNSQAGAKLLRRALMSSGHIREWTSVLQLIATTPGKPKQNIAQSDSLRFYKVPTSYSSIDRILLTLASRYPSRFEQVCTVEFTAREVALELGWIKIPAPTLRRFMDDAAALGDADQAQLLLQLFSVVTAEARTSFLADLGVHKNNPPQDGRG